MVDITPENKSDYEKGFLCPKCGEPTNTYRHPWARRWCPSCGYILREEGDRSKYDYTEHINFEVASLLEALARIRQDKDTFETCGRDTKGHSRAIMLIKELILEISSKEK